MPQRCTAPLLWCCGHPGPDKVTAKALCACLFGGGKRFAIASHIIKVMRTAHRPLHPKRHLSTPTTDANRIQDCQTASRCCTAQLFKVPQQSPFGAPFSETIPCFRGSVHSVHLM